MKDSQILTYQEVNEITLREFAIEFAEWLAIAAIPHEK